MNPNQFHSTIFIGIAGLLMSLLAPSIASATDPTVIELSPYARLQSSVITDDGSAAVSYLQPSHLNVPLDQQGYYLRTRTPDGTWSAAAKLTESGFHHGRFSKLVDVDASGRTLWLILDETDAYTDMYYLGGGAIVRNPDGSIVSSAEDWQDGILVTPKSIPSNTKYDRIQYGALLDDGTAVVLYTSNGVLKYQTVPPNATSWTAPVDLGITLPVADWASDGGALGMADLVNDVFYVYFNRQIHRINLASMSVTNISQILAGDWARIDATSDGWVGAMTSTNAVGNNIHYQQRVSPAGIVGSSIPYNSRIGSDGRILQFSWSGANLDATFSTDGVAWSAPTRIRVLANDRSGRLLDADPPIPMRAEGWVGDEYYMFGQSSSMTVNGAPSTNRWLNVLLTRRADGSWKSLLTGGNYHAGQNGGPCSPNSPTAENIDLPTFSPGGKALVTYLSSGTCSDPLLPGNIEGPLWVRVFDKASDISAWTAPIGWTPVVTPPSTNTPSSSEPSTSSPPPVESPSTTPPPTSIEPRANEEDKTESLQLSLVSATAKLNRTRCKMKTAIRDGKQRWCYRLIAKVRLVDTDRLGMDDETLRIAYSPKLATTTQTNAQGWATTTKNVTVPESARSSLKRARKWIATQFKSVTFSYGGDTEELAVTSKTVRTRIN